MDKQKWILGAAVLVLLAATVLALWLFGRTDPAVAELQQMGEQMFDPDLPEAQRNELRSAFRERIQVLSDDQRQAFFESNRGRWMGRIEQRMDQFFALSPAEQRQRLDDILDRANQPRPERRQGGGRAGRGNRGNWGNLTEAQRDERSKRRLDQTSPKLRAQFTEFRRLLEDRAEQRGIPVPDWGRGPRG